MSAVAARVGAGPDDRLTELFYEECTQYKNPFIRDWFSFERDLRNLLAAVAVRGIVRAKDDVDRRAIMEKSVLGRNEIADAILKSSAPDFSVSSMLSWSPVVMAQDPAALTENEKRLDRLRWDMAGELTALAGFGIETVMAFLVRFILVHRWLALDAVTGKRMFEALVEGLKKSVSFEQV